MFASLHHRWHTFQRRFALQPRHHQITEIIVVLVLLFWISPLTLTARPHDQYGHTNVLLLGVGDKDHDGADLTDSMMLASINPRTGSLVLLSIPRDLYVTGDDHVPDGRINLLYFSERARLAREKKWKGEKLSNEAMRAVAGNLGEKFGVQIHGVIKADFTAFTQVLDRLGGLDIDVPEKIIDTQYPLTEHTIGLLKIDSGRQHFDGETALRYARTRHSGSDFDRSARQQQILEAMSQKVRRMSRLHQFIFALAFLRAAEEHIETTFTLRQILGLAKTASALSRERVITKQIDFNLLVSGDPALYEGASVLLPAPQPDDPSGLKHLRSFVQLLLQQRT